MRYATLIILALLFASCGDERKQADMDENYELPKVDKSETQQMWSNIKYESARLSDSSTVVSYPLLLTQVDGTSDEGYPTRSLVYWNIAFYNHATKQSYLLTNRKMMIMSYDDGSSNGASDVVVYKHAGSGEPNKKRLSFYRVICDDFNKNGKLDENDPVYLFVSDIDGKNFKQLSPKNMSVTDWKVSASDSRLYITVTADTDADQAFTDKDKSMPYTADLKALNIAAPVFEKDFNEAAGNEFKRLWVQGKK